MKIGILSLIRRRLGMILCTIFLMVYQLPMGLAHNEDNQEEVLLEQALQEIGRKYRVYFSYDRTLIDNVKVELSIDSYESVDDALTSVMGQTNLFYQIFDHRYVAVYQNTKEGLESLKKMVQHFQKIIDKQEMVNKRRVNLLSPITTFSAKELYDKRLVVNVSGLVMSSEGEPLIGVNVLVKGTDIGTATDFDGKFELYDIDENAILVITYIGYQSKEISVAGKKTITIVLQEDSQTLDEVVVVGYGTQRKRDMTTAVSTISQNDIVDRPITRIEQAIQGVVPGVQVQNQSGAPGGSLAMSIRGVSTVSSNPILYLIDGIPSPIDRINPNDIESISILKDVAATAIYGSRASAGVVLITTKTGKSGKLSVNYNSSISLQSPTRFTERVSSLDHMLLTNEARINDGSPLQYSEEQIAEAKSPDFIDYDWEGTLLSPALQTNHNISISGGTDIQDYYLSFGYLNQDGIVLNSGYERFNIRLNQNFNLSRKLELSFKGDFTHSDILSPATQNWGTFFQRARFHGVKSPDGKWLKHPESVGGGANPVADMSADGGRRIDKTNRLLTNIGLKYNMLDGLSIEGKYGVRLDLEHWDKYLTRLKYYDQYNQEEVALQRDYNQLEINNSKGIMQNIDFLATYTKKISNHDFLVMGGTTAEWYFDQNEYSRTRDFLTEGLYTINAGSKDRSVWDISGSAFDWSILSVISRVSYSYKDKYLLNGTIRYDGSSRFTEDFRWGLFPSFSLGWILSEENMLKNNSVLTFLKLRGSWGKVGNQNALGYYPFASTLNQSVSYFNLQPQVSVAPTGTPNPLLTWESKASFNIGLEGSIFDNMLEFNIDLFQERTSDILLVLPVPTTYGQAAPVQNAGVFENKGWEVELLHRNTIGDFSYGVMLQISDTKDKVIDLRLPAGQSISGDEITKEGSNWKSWYGYRNLGYFKSDEDVTSSPFQNQITSPGDLKYENNGGNPEVIDGEDRVNLGRIGQHLPYGVKLNMSYRNIDFSMFFQGVMENLIRSEDFTAFAFSYSSSTLYSYHLDRWTPDNPDPNARFPKLRNAQNYPINTQFSDFWLEDGSYLRLKNIELGYSISDRLLQKMNIGNVRLNISAENMLVLTKYLGFDPELSSSYRYPLPKLINFGLNVNF